MRLTIFLLLLIFARLTQSQNCATIASEQMLRNMKQYHSHKRNIKFEKTKMIYYIPLKVHLMGYLGFDYGLPSSVMDEICHLNELMAPSNFFFYLEGDINYIQDGRIFNHDITDRNTFNILKGFVQEGVANLFVVDSIRGGTPGSTVAGYYTSFADAMVVTKGQVGTGKSTVVHEVGHYFNLLHPFETENGEENVARSGTNKNCETAGDGFCDTEADFQDYPWLCPYNDVEVDAQGERYKPDHTLYMSYADDNCRSRFTTEQQEAMDFFLNKDRSYLKSAAPRILSLETPSVHYPPNGEIEVDYVPRISWSSVSNADYYNLVISERLSFSGDPVIDLLLRDTFFTISLKPDTRYYWKVRSASAGNLCESYGSTARFTTSDHPGPLVGVINQERQSFSLYPNPVRQGIPLQIQTTKKAKIDVVSVNGNMLNSFTALPDQDLSIQTNSFEKGVYFIRIRTEQGVTNQSLLVY